MDTDRLLQKMVYHAGIITPHDDEWPCLFDALWDENLYELIPHAFNDLVSVTEQINLLVNDPENSWPLESYAVYMTRISYALSGLVRAFQERLIKQARDSRSEQLIWLMQYAWAISALHEALLARDHEDLWEEVSLEGRAQGIMIVVKDDNSV